MEKKTKIVIDADVIIHFLKGGYLSLLHKIFPEYQYVILDIVLNKELRKHRDTRIAIDNHLNYCKYIQIENWNPNNEMIKEFAYLSTKYGLGESASMVYCKYNQDVIASSNITEITNYCNTNNITYVTTMDFLWTAYITKKMTETECNDFISKVLSAKSKLPVKRITDYTPREICL
ncbi:hypothetical protein EZS27_036443 [termite gut metagenome]|uniref:PIN domain-containing protein n=1 Tax=termite gut metagenome TaxID=433724 RepID=A0A5J4PV57_9ZZZZ